MKNRSSKTKLSRRTFVVGTTAAAGGGLALGFHMPADAASSARAQTAQSEGVEVNAWLLVEICVHAVVAFEPASSDQDGVALANLDTRARARRFDHLAPNDCAVRRHLPIEPYHVEKDASGYDGRELFDPAARRSRRTAH